MNAFVESASDVFSDASPSASSGNLLADGPSGDSVERMRVLALIAAAGICYFLAAWFRYHNLRAGALDLGVWDQTMFLIAQGKAPFSTILGIHMLSDHAAVLIYAIAQLYRIYPTVCWLLLVQSASMAGAAWPIWRLARIAGINPPMARTLIVSYLLYPVVAIASLRDFYPEVVVVPALLAMILCARQQRFGWFVFWLLIGLSTKEAMAITFAATGLYLTAFGRSRMYGIVCFTIAVLWFVIATKFVIPWFGQGHQPDSARFYSYMGHSQAEVLRTMFLRPWVPLKVLLDTPSLLYLAAIFVPVIWGLSPTRLSPLLCALPCVLLIMLSTKEEFHSPSHHYSLPVVPFVFLALINSLVTKRRWLVPGKYIVIWSVAIVLAGIAARVGKASSKVIPVARDFDKRRLIAMVNDDGGVIASHQMVPHLAHRDVIQFIYGLSEPTLSMPPDDRIDWVVMDFDEDSMRNAGKSAVDILRKYEADPDFKQVYHEGSLYLFHRDRARL